MEETFIITYVCILVIGIILGFLACWILDKDNKNIGGSKDE
jgi:hypothetical protein